MEVALTSEMELSSSALKKIISNDYQNIIDIQNLNPNLDQYDFFFKGEQLNGSECTS